MGTIDKSYVKNLDESYLLENSLLKCSKNKPMSGFQIVTVIFCTEKIIQISGKK